MRKHFILFFLTVSVIISAASAQDLFNGPECVVFDEVYNRYLVSNYNDGSVVELFPDGTTNYWLEGLGHCLGNTIYNGVFYVSTGYYLKGYDLDTKEQVFNQWLMGSQQLDGMSADGNGFMYLTDYHYNTADKVFKVDLTTGDYWVFATDGLANAPQDLYLDSENNRLIIAPYFDASPIQAVSLEDSLVTDITISPMGDFDGITRGNDSCFYLTTWSNNTVIRYDSDFTNPPEVFATGFNGPSNLDCNLRDDILAVPNFNLNRVDLIEMSSGVLNWTNDGTVCKSSVLLSCSPNPFNPATNIHFELFRQENISLKVFNSKGELVGILFEGSLNPGLHTYKFNGGNLSGGVYFAQLNAGFQSNSSRLVLIK